VFRKIVKGTVDSLIRKLSQALPEWQDYVTETTFAAPAPYQPTLPANVEMFSPAVKQRLGAFITFRAHRILQLNNVHVTWDGAVFHNLRLFIPSVVLTKFASRFQDTLLLRQWVGKKVDLSASCVAVCHDQWSAGNYYHWLVDTLPRLLVLRQAHPGMLLLLPQPTKPMPDYIQASAAVLGFTRYQFLAPGQILRARCVILPELTAPSLTQNPVYIHRVQQELVAALSPESVPAFRRIYGARDRHGVRSIVNEAELDDSLAKLGFEKVYFEDLTLSKQVNLMRETAIFLGVHGAGMANMIFLQQGAKVIELLNEEYGDQCYFRLASCLNLAYFLAPCTGTSGAQKNQSDMVVKVSLLKRIMEAALISYAD